MDLALAATSDFAGYTYTSKTKILFDDHHDEYEVDFVEGDKFKIQINGGNVILIHADAPKVKFICPVTDKKYIKLMRGSTPAAFEFIPTPKFPHYPFIPRLTFELIPHIYEYLNNTYFNGMCPKSILFKKSTSKEALGVAMYDKVRGRELFRMKVNMKMIGNDMILFIDTLLHEMIHLYLYRKGLDQHRNDILQDGHGVYFQAEMNRLNKLGFNISIILQWEQRDQEIASEYYVLAITDSKHPKNGKYFWTTTNIERDFQTFVAQITKYDPASLFTIELYATKNQALKGQPMIQTNGKIPESKLGLWWKKQEVGGRMVQSFQVTPQSAVDSNQFIKVPKAEEVYYAQPLAVFSSWLRKTKINYANDDAAYSIWIRFPVAKIIPFAEAELIEIHKALARGLADQDIKRRLTAVFARFDNRANQGEYRRAITAIIEKHKLDALLQYPQLGL